MPTFSPNSEKNLSTCRPELQEVLGKAIKEIDFSVTCGFRGKEEQNKRFAEGTSRVKYPNGMHNVFPSNAVDIRPYPHDPNDLDAFLKLAEVIERVARCKGYDVRCMGKEWGWDFYHYEYKGKV